MFDTGVGSTKKLFIGNNCKIGDYVHRAADEKVTIGNGCIIEENTAVIRDVPKNSIAVGSPTRVV